MPDVLDRGFLRNESGALVVAGPNGAPVGGGSGSTDIDKTGVAAGQGLVWDEDAEKFVPASLVRDPGAGVDQDILIASDTGWERLPVGNAGDELTVRTDGTVNWTQATRVSLAAWGAKGDGTTNDFAAVDAAWEQALTIGGVVDGGGRVYRMAPTVGNSLTLPPNLTRRVAFTNAELKLTNTCTSLFTHEAGTYTDADTFRGLRVENVVVDANNTAANFQGVVANITPQNANLDDLTFRGLEVKNVGNLSSTNNRRCFNIGVLRNDRFNAALRNTVTRVTVENVKLGATGGGGNTGVFIHGTSNLGPGTIAEYAAATVPLANVILDQIVVRNMTWTSGSNPGALFVSSGAQVGGDGECREVHVENCAVYGAGDVGYEFNSPLDGHFTNNYAENCWTCGHFISNNNGGMVNFRRQTAVFRNCTSVRSRSQNTTMSGFSAQATRGSRFGHLVYENCTFRHEAPDFRSGTNTFLNPTEPPFRIAGPFLKATFRGCRAIYDNLALDQLANNQTQTPAGIAIGSHGYESVVEVDGFDFVFNGTGDNVHTGGQLQVQPVSVGGSRVHVDIKGVRVGTRFTKMLTGFSVRDIATAATGGTGLTDNWSASGTLASDYIIDVGQPTDVSQTTGTGVVSVANPTVVKRARALQMRNTTSINHQIGKALDATYYASATVPTEAPDGFQLEARLRIDETTGDELRAVLSDDGAATTFRVEVVAAGVATVVQGPTTVTRLTTGQTVGVRLKQSKNTIVGDYFTNGTVPSAITSTGATTLTHTFTTASDIAKWGEAGPGGWVGWGWAPGTNSGILKTQQYVRMLVLSGSIEKVTALGDRGATNPGSHYGLYINSTTAQGTRFESPLRLSGWDRHRIAGNANVDDVLQVTADAQQKQMIRIADSALAAPPSPVAVTVSTGTFVWTNDTMFGGWFETRGGTLTTPFVRTSHDAANWTQRAGSSAEQRVYLAPGDSIEITSSSAPTAQFVQEA